MSTTTSQSVSPERLVDALRDPCSYREPIEGAIQLHETHISWVFLTDRFAYKVKKPITTDYLDYSTLERREHFCREELRLNRRYAPGLYMDVIPITWQGDKLGVGGPGEVIEYAVKMHRFPDGALLSERLAEGDLQKHEVHELATRVAEFHGQASTSREDAPYGQPQQIAQWVQGNFDELRAEAIRGQESTLRVVQKWSERFCREHETLFRQRVTNGFIRECHGDLHLANVVTWQQRLMPFDGIEFNGDLRWIDVLSDAAFLAMDFAARGHRQLSRSFVSCYLEHTGDYASLALLRFYLVYRAMVRAKIAAMRAAQPALSQQERQAQLQDSGDHLELAYNYTEALEPALWITHGYSGSGKSTGCEAVVQHHAAVRLRSDMERKRFYGLPPLHHPSGRETEKLYTPSARQATYCRLKQLALHVLRAGFPVIIDATFLNAEHRAMFAELAQGENVPFQIIDFPCDESILRQRISDRLVRGSDASDAGIEVLEWQLRTAEPLTAAERKSTVAFADLYPKFEP